MVSSPECITWMVVGLTESVAIIALNSLIVIAFCRDHNLRKRSTYLVISFAVADMLSGGPSSLDLVYNVGVMCNFWRYNTLHWYQILQVLLLCFPVCSLTNMTVISLERLNATFWPFRHRTIKKSVYWVLIIAIWVTTLLFSCASRMIHHYAHKRHYYLYTLVSFISICLLSFVFLMFLFLSSFALEISLDTKERQTGRGTDRDVVHRDFSLSPIVLALCYNYFSFFCHYHIKVIVCNSAFPFVTWVNNLALRKLFFKSLIIYYENARF